MATDLFQSRAGFGGALSMDDATLSFASVGGNEGSTDETGLGALIQSTAIQYARPVQRMYELGSQGKAYYIIGRPEGKMQITRLAAPKPISDAFLQRFASVCDVAGNSLQISASPGVVCNTGADNVITRSNSKGSSYKFSYFLISGMSLNISIQSITMAENLSIDFAKLERTTTDLSPRTTEG